MRVPFDMRLVFPVIPTSLLALGNVDGEREELVVLGRVMINYKVVYTSMIFYSIVSKVKGFNIF